MLHKSPIITFFVGILISGCNSVTIDTEYDPATNLPAHTSNSDITPIDDVNRSSHDVYLGSVEKISFLSEVD